MERKAIILELKDLDNNKRTAVIAHAVYDVIDKTGDISCRGMFNKSWKENKSIDFLFNHEKNQIVGTVLRTFEDENKAYTEVKFGSWTLGNDVLEMADMGVLRGASFGYIAEKKEFVNIKGRKIRKLKEVYHGETSLLTDSPANPLAGVVSLTKSLDDVELKAMYQEQLDNMEKFCRDSNASDQCIKSILSEIENTKQFISQYNTAITQERSPEPAASVERKELLDALTIFKKSLILQ